MKTKILYIVIALLLVLNVTLFLLLTTNQNKNNNEYKNSNQVESSSSSNNNQPESKPKPKYNRDELRNLIIGKTQNQVIEIIRKPERTSDIATGHQLWYYNGISYDSVTDKVDYNVQVVFLNGRCILVNF